jgi:hypothetical protein
MLTHHQSFLLLHAFDHSLDHLKPAIGIAYIILIISLVLLLFVIRAGGDFLHVAEVKKGRDKCPAAEEKPNSDE